MKRYALILAMVVPLICHGYDYSGKSRAPKVRDYFRQHLILIRNRLCGLGVQARVIGYLKLEFEYKDLKVDYSPTDSTNGIGNTGKFRIHLPTRFTDVAVACSEMVRDLDSMVSFSWEKELPIVEVEIDWTGKSFQDHPDRAELEKVINYIRLMQSYEKVTGDEQRRIELQRAKEEARIKI